jgi:hypothetical protein
VTAAILRIVVYLMLSVLSILDVPACLASDLEILTEPPAGELNYTRAFRLDDEGHDALVEVLQLNGNCTSCSGSLANESFPVVVRGFRAEIRGVVTNTSYTTTEGEVLPATVRLLSVARSNDATTICGVAVEQVAPPAPSPTAGNKAPSPTAGNKAPSPTSGGYSTAPVWKYLGALVTAILAPVVLL